ncbi:MAG: hypothetical protein LBE16_02850, partial [Clostridiales Family XIII bacterium]|nr:hypothetical protein [Clostridiales Family XIII bacterium]
MAKAVHIIRYGTVSDTVCLEKAIHTYDLLGINGNMVAYTPGAIAKFIARCLFKRTNKGFFVDPITYAFQDKVELLEIKSKKGEGRLKKSIDKLIEIYGEPSDKIRQMQPIRTSDFQEQRAIDTFCERVLRFQFARIKDFIEEAELERYLLYAAELTAFDPKSRLEPKFLIAPYFYLNGDDKDWRQWLTINLKFIRKSMELSSGSFHEIPVFGQIVISKGLLSDQDGIERICREYSNVNCAGINIWVDGFNEQEVDYNLLRGYVDLLRRLKVKNRPVYNMYGGYFSTL